nr:MAG TPA: hypothetical protein [Caudoviricetes sp.]
MVNNTIYLRIIWNLQGYHIHFIAVYCKGS